MASPHRIAARARERRYRRIAADPAIAARTNFFAAAVVVTRALGAREQPPFLVQLAAMLEVANVRRAHEIRAGRLYETGAPRANTADFVHFEQALVEAELARLRARDERAWHAVVDCANAQLRRATRGVARWVNREFARAAREARRQLGRDIDFARREDRELLGNEIARAAGGRAEGAAAAGCVSASDACRQKPLHEQVPDCAADFDPRRRVRRR
jgi:hypothetical protein